MRTDATDLVRERTGRGSHRAAAEYDRARRERAETHRRCRGVAIAQRDLRRIEAEFLGSNLRKHRLMPLPVVLHADLYQNRAVRHHACQSGLVAWDQSAAPLGPFCDAVPALAGIEREANADVPPVRLPPCLPCADRP